MPPLIYIQNLVYSYPDTGMPRPPALRGVSLTVEEGEYVAIIGANGSGKTTLARHLNGLLLPTSGKVHVLGMDTRESRSLSPIRAAIGMVFQSPEDQIISTIVEEDVAFGLENLGVPQPEIRPRVEAALQSVGMWEQRERPSYLLSAGQMQRVALAGVLAMRPRCIVFDEATALLDPVGATTVLDLVEQLHAEGLTIIAITHSMAEAARARRVVVMHQGQVALDDSPEAVFAQENQLFNLGVSAPPAARLASALLPSLPVLPVGILRLPQLLASLPAYQGRQQNFVESPNGHEPRSEAGPEIITAHNLGHIYLAGTPLARRALQTANLTVHQSSVHGILGATGSGKSTLLQHLNGLLIPQEGQVQVGPFNLNDPKVDLKAVRKLAGLAFQLPEMQFFEQYVGDEIAYGPRMLGHAGTLREAVRQAMEMVGLDFEAYKDRLVAALSGGERRKVALASILAFQPPILLLDEPTAGLDPASRLDLINRLKVLRAGGTTLVISSHHMEEAADLADRLTVMGAGRDAISGKSAAVFNQVETLHELGLEPPATVQVAAALRQRGWPLPLDLLQTDDLVRAVAALVRMEGR